MKPTDIKAAMRDTLFALVEQGPLPDGSEPCRLSRDVLIKNGLAVRVVVLGQDGFTAATYQGRDVYRLVCGTSLGGDADTIAEAHANRLASNAVQAAMKK